MTHYKAHVVDVKILGEKVKVKIPSKADIIIMSNGGYPLDKDLSSSQIHLHGEAIVKRGRCHKNHI